MVVLSEGKLLEFCLGVSIHLEKTKFFSDNSWQKSNEKKN